MEGNWGFKKASLDQTLSTVTFAEVVLTTLAFAEVAFITVAFAKVILLTAKAFAKAD